MAGVNIGRMLPDWADYGKFVDFAKSGDVGDKTLVVGTPSNLVKATGDRIGKLRRTDAEKEANNGVRDLFRTSVLKLFRLKSNEESKLPASVKKAMELDDNNKGKPLSVRRIKTVDAAIRKLVAADLGKKLSVSPDFERGELFGEEGDQGKGGAQLACKVFGNRKAYDGVLGQISMDVYRDSKSRIPEKERKRFVAEPYCMCNGQKGPLFGFMVNGRQVPVPKKNGDTAEIERFVNLSLAKELTERKPVKRLLLNGERPGDFIPLKPADPLAGNGGVGLIVTGKNAVKVVTRDELELKRTAMYFCQQSAFSFGENVFWNTSFDHAGKPIGDRTRDVIYTTNVVRSPDGSGYDIAVRQKYTGIVGMKDDGSEAPKSYFDPMNPGSWSATCVYHIGMEGGKPVVSFKEPPEVRANLPKPISKKKFVSQTWKFAEAHKDEIIQAMGADDLEWWNRFDEGEKAEKFNQAVSLSLEDVSDGKFVSVNSIAGHLSGFKGKVEPSRDALNFDLELAQAQADVVFDGEGAYDDNLRQIAKEVAGDKSARLTPEEEDSFVKNPRMQCIRSEGRVRGCMLNGRQIPVPGKPGDLSAVRKAAGAFLLSALPAQRKKIGPADLRKAGVSVAKPPADGFIDLRKRPADLKRVAGLLGDRKVAGDLAGLVATGKGGFKAVTARELALNRVAVSFCQQSSQRTLQRIVQHDARLLGGRPVFDPNDRTFYTTNVVPAEDGYDVIVYQDVNAITGVRKAGGTQNFDPGNPGKISLYGVYHIGMEGGRPKVSFKERPSGTLNYPKPDVK